MDDKLTRGRAVFTALGLIIAGLTWSGIRGTEIAVLDWLHDGDADQDGMPSAWEAQHGLDPLKNDSYVDPDHDGMLNIDEYVTGTEPRSADTDHDRVLDGVDRFPLNVTRVPMNSTFAPGLLWSDVDLGISALSCQARTRTDQFPHWLFDTDYTGWDPKGCMSSPGTTLAIAKALHPLANTPWNYVGGDLEATPRGKLGERVYEGTDAALRFQMDYTLNKQTYGTEVVNTIETPLTARDGTGYQYATFPLHIPAIPARDVSIELQGYTSSAGLIGFDARFYATTNYEHGVFEERNIVVARPTEGGGFLADFPIPNLPEGDHVLFLMPMLLDADRHDAGAPHDFALYSALERRVDGIVLDQTEDATLLDGAPRDVREIVANTTSELLVKVQSEGIHLEAAHSEFSLVESFTQIGVIPDATARVTLLTAGHDGPVAGVKGVFVTYEKGSSYTVTSTSTKLVHGNDGPRLLTRTTSETYSTLPKSYEKYVDKGIIESTTHAGAFATEIANDGKTLLSSAEGEGIAAATTKLEATLGGANTALEEVSAKAAVISVAKHVVGSGLVILDLVDMSNDWSDATRALHAGDSVGAAHYLLLFASSAVSAAAIVLPFAPFAAAVATIIAITLQALASPMFFQDVADKIGGTASILGGKIPAPDQRRIYAQAARDFADLGDRNGAPLFIGQLDDDGNAQRPPQLEGSQDPVGGWFYVIVGIALLILLCGGASRLLGR